MFSSQQLNLIQDRIKALVLMEHPLAISTRLCMTD